MRERNINFQEKYKSVDKFIKDAYGTKEGVSEYLRIMESKNSIGLTKVALWKDDYYKLKHARWVRNQLAHEASIDSDICEKEDYDWICGFYSRLMRGQDALALLSKEQKKKPVKSGNKSNNAVLWLIVIAAVIIALIYIFK